LPKRKTSAAPQNRLLARLPEAIYRRLLPQLEPINLRRDDILYEPRTLITHAYFPIGAVLSAVTVMEDGSMIEVATVGNEGMVGNGESGSSISPHRVLVQIQDGALRIRSQALHKESARSSQLKALLNNYRAAFMTQVSQSVACNGLHSLEQRCCRWLLMSQDRVGSRELHLTHEYLAIMLGARRASVTDVLRPLQKADLVSSRRGTISILDASGLEARVCECYRVVRGEYDRLLG
jgi:CRP-like cAMP-binding protein